MKTIYIFAPFDAIPGEGGFPGRFGALKMAIEALGHRCIWWVSDWQHAGKVRRESSPLHTDVRLLPSPEYHANVGLARLRSHRALARAYIREASAAIESGEIPAPDVQLYSLPPLDSAAACRCIQQKFGGSLILDVMDVWPDTFFQMISFVPKRLRPTIGRLIFYPFLRQARSAVRMCDALTAQSKSFLDWGIGLGYRGNTSHVCYLGAEMAAEVLPRQYQKNECLRLAYLGMMGMSYDLETLLYAMRALVDEGHSVSLDLAGTGPKESDLKALTADLGLDASIRFHGYLRKDALDSMLMVCHVGIVPMFPDSGVVVPYKACEYTSSGLGIVHSLPGELDDTVTAFSAGTYYQVESVASLVQAIKTYIKDPETVERHSTGAIRLARDHFDRRHTYNDFAEYVAAIGKIEPVTR